MINIPLFCNSCGAIFPSGILVDNFTTTSLGDTNGSCPYCGGAGYVKSDVYYFIGRTIELLNSPNKTVFELNKLAQIINNFQDNESGVHDIRRQIEKEVPKFTSIVDLLPRKEVYQHIQLILFIITIIITLATRDQLAPITTEKIIEELYKHLTPSDTLPADLPNNGENKNSPVAKVGRNELCTCGSGKKYKKCCGNNSE